MSGRSALFIEREGVLIADAPADAAAVRLLPRVAAAVRRLNLAGVAVVVTTDQPAIAAGDRDEAWFAATTQRLRDLLAADAGAVLDGVYHCPHPAPHAWRKPRPGMLLAAARDLGLDLFASWLVGVRADDLRAAAQAGCHGAVLIGADPPDEEFGLIVAQADDLADAPRVMIPRGGGCWHAH